MQLTESRILRNSDIITICKVKPVKIGYELHKLVRQNHVMTYWRTFARKEDVILASSCQIVERDHYVTGWI